MLDREHFNESKKCMMLSSAKLTKRVHKTMENWKNCSFFFCNLNTCSEERTCKFFFFFFFFFFYEGSVCIIPNNTKDKKGQDKLVLFYRAVSLLSVVLR